MREEAVRLCWQERGEVDYELIFGAIALVTILVAVFVPADRILADIGYRCPFRAMTGVPCPSCGATRAFVLAGSLRFADAVRINPLATVLFAAMVIYTPVALLSVVFRTKRLRLAGMGRREKRLIALAILLVALANWAYMLATACV